MTNPKALRRDGDVVECIGALSVLNASRAGGLNGIAAPEFLRYVITELQPTCGGAALEWQDSAALSKVWSSASTTVVPFIPRVDDVYPAGLGGELGELARAYNKDRLDISVSLNRTKILFGEMKNIKNVHRSESTTKKGSGGAGFSIYSSVLERFCNDGTANGSGSPKKNSSKPDLSTSQAPLGIVIVSRLTEITKSVDAQFLNNICVVRISVENGKLVVNRIGLIGYDTVTLSMVTQRKPRLLCFIECDENNIRTELRAVMDLADAFHLPQPPGAKVHGIVNALNELHLITAKKKKPVPTKLPIKHGKRQCVVTSICN